MKENERGRERNICYEDYGQIEEDKLSQEEESIKFKLFLPFIR